jgi:hypothetical protein
MFRGALHPPGQFPSFTTLGSSFFSDIESVMTVLQDVEWIINPAGQRFKRTGLRTPRFQTV